VCLPQNIPLTYICSTVKYNKNINLRFEGSTVRPGENAVVKANIARLASGTAIELPIYIFRSPNPGPVVLLSGGLHGDETNGIEVVRRLLERKSFQKLQRGSVVAVPVMNVFGFLNFSREVPDGKDINRSFPGNASGSLASRVAHFLTKHVLRQIDFGVDFHTGGASRYNYPQIRYAASDKNARPLADAFGAPLVLNSPLINRTLRKQAYSQGKTILVFEGGESLRNEETVIEEGMNGALRLLHSFNMIKSAPVQTIPKVECSKNYWIRAKRSGIYNSVLKSGEFVTKGDILGVITDPFGEFKVNVRAQKPGFILGHNNMPVVNQGDALLHLGHIDVQEA